MANREHLDSEAASYFGIPAQGPDDSFLTPEWFLTAIVRVANCNPGIPVKAPFEFTNTKEAADHNDKVLAAVDYDLEKLIRANADSKIGRASCRERVLLMV